MQVGILDQRLGLDSRLHSRCSAKVAITLRRDEPASWQHDRRIRVQPIRHYATMRSTKRPALPDERERTKLITAERDGYVAVSLRRDELSGLQHDRRVWVQPGGRDTKGDRHWQLDAKDQGSSRRSVMATLCEGYVSGFE